MQVVLERVVVSSREDESEMRGGIEDLGEGTESEVDVLLGLVAV